MVQCEGLQQVAKRAAMVVALLGVTVGLAVPASATVLVEDFNNFALGGPYGIWSDPTSTLTSGTDAFRVETLGGWGGGWYELPAVVDASGETAFELEITFGATNEVPVIVLGVEDVDGTFYNYAWYGLPVTGNQILSSTAVGGFWESAAGSTAGLDFGAIKAFHLQADGNDGTGAPTLAADIYFENLNATPEPATLALLAIGGLVVMRRRS